MKTSHEDGLGANSLVNAKCELYILNMFLQSARVSWLGKMQYHTYVTYSTWVQQALKDYQNMIFEANGFQISQKVGVKFNELFFVN